MRKLQCALLILTAFNFNSCKGQNEEKIIYPKEKIMNTDRFDIQSFNKHKEKYLEYEKMQIHLESLNSPFLKIDTLSNGTVVFSEEGFNKQIYYSQKIIVPPPSLFFTYKEYYSSGIIKEESEKFIGSLYSGYGITKYYDEQGYLVKTVDENYVYKDVKIKLLDLFGILKKEPMLGGLTREDKEHFQQLFFENKKIEEITSADFINYLLSSDIGTNGMILNPNNDNDRRNIEINFENNHWDVTKNIYPFGTIDYVIDANTGQILTKKYQKETRP